MTTPATLDRQALINADQVRTAAIRDRLVALIGTAWDAMPDHRDTAVDQWLRTAVPLVVGAQRQIGTLTVAHVRVLLRLATGQPVTAATADPPTSPAAIEVEAYPRIGVTPDAVYRRAAIAVWRSLSNGDTYEAAKATGRRRAVGLAAMDAQLARTRAAWAVLGNDPRATGYRRVLTGNEDCAMCVLASTQRYHKKELMPIHPGCDCGIDVLTGPDRHVIDEEQLEAVHRAVKDLTGESDRGGRAVDYKKLIVTRQHGELGPVLTLAQHKFTKL